MQNFTLYLLLSIAFLQPAHSQYLIPDNAFATNGSTTDVSTTSGMYRTLKQQADGKIVAYGYTNSNDIDYPKDFRLARFNTDGTLDTTFGYSGLVYTTSTDNSKHTSNQMELQPDGKILIVRMIDADPSVSITADIVVDRYNADGTIDTSFGINGSTSQHTSWGEAGFDIQVQQDNKILIVGWTFFNYYVFRLNADGTLDQTFGTNGSVTSSFTTTAVLKSFAVSIKQQSDGKIIVGGTYGYTSGSNDIAFVRLNTDGLLDTTFGVNGRVLYDSGISDTFESMQITPQDEIIVFVNSTGSFMSTTTAPKILKYTANGQLDNTYGTNGVVYPLLNAAYVSEWIFSTTVDANQKFLCLGRLISDSYQQFLARYNMDGTLDATFADGGFQVFPYIGMRIYVQNDGKILAGGNQLKRYTLGMLANEQFPKNQFSVTPNPFSDKITLNFSLNASQKLSADLFDNNGRKIKNLIQDKTFSSGNNTTEIQMPESLSKGVYLIKIFNGSTNTTLKIIK